MARDKKIGFIFKDLGNGISILRLKGELNSLTEEKVRMAVDNAMEKSGHKLILELSLVPYTNSAGTGLIIDAFKTARDHGGKIVLLNPVDMVLEVFNLVGLPQIVDVKFNLNQALECFGPEYRNRK